MQELEADRSFADRVLRWDRRTLALLACGVTTLAALGVSGWMAGGATFLAAVIVLAINLPVVLGGAYLCPARSDVVEREGHLSRLWVRRYGSLALVVLAFCATVEAATGGPADFVLGRAFPWLTGLGATVLLAFLVEGLAAPLLGHAGLAAAATQLTLIGLALAYPLGAWKSESFDWMLVALGSEVSGLTVVGILSAAPFLAAGSWWSFTHRAPGQATRRVLAGLTLLAAGVAASAITIHERLAYASTHPPRDGVIMDVQTSGDGKTLLVAIQTPPHWWLDSQGRRVAVVTARRDARFLPGLAVAADLARSGELAVVRRPRPLGHSNALEWIDPRRPESPVARTELPERDLPLMAGTLLTDAGTYVVRTRGRLLCLPAGNAGKATVVSSIARYLQFHAGQGGSFRAVEFDDLESSKSSALLLGDPGSCDTRSVPIDCAVARVEFANGGDYVALAAPQAPSCEFSGSASCVWTIRRLRIDDDPPLQLPTVQTEGPFSALRQLADGAVAWWLVSPGGAPLSWLAIADTDGVTRDHVLPLRVVDVAGTTAASLFVIYEAPGSERDPPSWSKTFQVGRLLEDGTLLLGPDQVARCPRAGFYSYFINPRRHLPELDDGSLVAWTDHEVLRFSPRGPVETLWHWDPARAR